jgi:hypothetical protein
MFIGHYAVGIAGRAAFPGTRAPSLGTWFLAVQWLDLIWPIFVLTGVERVEPSGNPNPFLGATFSSYPWSHSLLFVVCWAALIALLYLRQGGTRIGALCLGAAVASHWLLDFIVHVPDLQLTPMSDTRVGLGLWRSVAGTVLLEGTMFVAALVWYLRRTRPRDTAGRWSIFGAAILLAGIYGMLATSRTPPPNAMAIALPALLLWLFVPWGYWIDRHRAPAA